MTALDLVIFAQGQMGRRPGGGPPFGPGGPGPGPGNPAADAGIMGALAGLMICYLVFIALIIAFSIIVHWKIFTKAGEPGWACIVPVYNVMILSKICGRGELFGLLCLVPCVNIVVGIMLTFDLAKVFGKDVGFAIGLLLLPIVFLPILAFGSAEYVGTSGGGGRRSRRRRDDDDYDRPRRGRRDEDDEDRPRRRRDEDDEDDRPRRARRDEDEDDRPRREDDRIRRKPKYDDY
jgi:hypothetical protein